MPYLCQTKDAKLDEMIQNIDSPTRFFENKSVILRLVLENHLLKTYDNGSN
jgi:hypothetical protein